jgi:hypothetical protein
VREGQTSPHRPRRLVVSRSTCPPLSSPPHANSFVILGPAAIKHTHLTHTPHTRSLSHSPSAPPPSFTQSPYPSCSLVQDGQTNPHRPRLVVFRSTCLPLSPPPPREQLCNRSCTVIKHTHLIMIASKSDNGHMSENLS